MRSEFVMVSILTTSGIKTTSWDCKSAARINVLPPSKEKQKHRNKTPDSAHI